MTNANIYKDISERTGGDIYIGIVGCFLYCNMKFLLGGTVGDLQRHFLQRCIFGNGKNSMGKRVVPKELLRDFFLIDTQRYFVGMTDVGAGDQ